MANPSIIISGRIDIPNYLFKQDGSSYIGEFIVQSGTTLQMYGTTPNEQPFPIFFRNQIILHKENFMEVFSLKELPALENELLSKKFQNTKYKIEKIIKFTNSK